MNKTVKKHNKPTGATGFLRINKMNITNYIINFPKTKEEIEKLIMNKWVEVINNKYSILTVYKWIKNRENDLDFTITTNYGNMLVDLMEIAPLSKYETNYQNSPNNFNSIKFGDNITQQIGKKSENYKAIKTAKILITYVTDYKFNLDSTTIAYLQYKTNKITQCFANIFHYEIILNDIRLIFPTPIKNFDINKFKNSYVINLG